LLRLATFVYDAVAATQSTLIAGLFALAVTFITWLGLLFFGRLAIPWLNRKALRRSHQELYFDSEFVLEGRTSHLWFDDRFVGAIRHWSTVDRIIEFEQGMWLMLHKRGLSREGYLISKESLPGSCAWDEFKAYVDARIAEGARSRGD
jgi:hypothetical protein